MLLSHFKREKMRTSAGVSSISKAFVLSTWRVLGDLVGWLDVCLMGLLCLLVLHIRSPWTFTHCLEVQFGAWRS